LIDLLVAAELGVDVLEVAALDVIGPRAFALEDDCGVKLCSFLARNKVPTPDTVQQVKNRSKQCLAEDEVML
jgi:hypothetical protein